MSTLKANSYQHVDRASPSITINSDGSVSISSTVTYEDVTSVDSVGIITARSGLNVTAGISTFGDDVVFTGAAANTTWDKSANALVFNDHASIQVGTGTDLIIKHDGSHSYIQEGGTGQLKLDASTLEIRNYANSNTMAKFVGDVQVELYHNNTKRLTTTTSGISVSDELNVVGLTTIGGDVSIADKIIHTGDTNTAIRFPAADTITAETGGTERLRINSAGNVKIAGAGSTTSLYLYADETTAYNGSATDGQLTAGATLFIENDGNANNTVNQIVMQSRSGYEYNRIVTTGGSTPEMAICVNDAERLRIASDGYVGISEDDPQALLHLNAGASSAIMFGNTTHGYKIRANVTGSHDYGLLIEDEDGVDLYRAVASTGTSNADTHTFFTDALERLKINSSGQIAINASSGNAPTHWDSSTRLSVNGRINSVGSASTASMNTGNGTVVNIGALTNHNLQFIVNNSTKATINTDGNAKFVGIVTATDFIADSQITHKNMVDNGGMVIAQRDQAASGSSTTAWVPTCDRFVFFATNTDQASFDFSQEPMNQAIPGLSRYLKVTPNTAETSDAANEYFTMYTTLEAQQLQRLKWGTASAETCTLSFWVKSSNTGTFCVNFYKMDATGYMTTRLYTVDVADTWEKKIITIPGLTASGIANDSGNGLRIHWILDAGSDFKGTNSGSSWVGATNAAFAYGHNINMINNTSKNWNITGIQFEIGSEATPFEVLPYTIDLQRCMRYYQQFGGSGTTLGRLPMMGECTSSTVAQYPLKFSVPMRGTSAPTLVSGTASNYKVYSGNSSTDCTSVAIAVGFKNQEPYGDIWGVRLNMNVASGLSAGHAAQAYNSTTGDVLGFDAEFPA